MYFVVEEGWNFDDEKRHMRFEDASLEDLNSLFGQWERALSGHVIVRVNQSQGVLWHECVLDAGERMILFFYRLVNDGNLPLFEGRVTFVGCPHAFNSFISYFDEG